MSPRVSSAFDLSRRLSPLRCGLRSGYGGEFPAWLRYVNASTADLAIEFITATRSRIREEARIGIFYSHIRNSGIYGQLDCERVLDTAPPDFVIGAACNRPFAIGGNSGYIGVTEMLRRRKINFLFECDRITSDANLKLTDYFTLSGGIWNGWKNPQEDVAGLKRELGMCMVNRLSFGFSISGAECIGQRRPAP